MHDVFLRSRRPVSGRIGVLVCVLHTEAFKKNMLLIRHVFALHSCPSRMLNQHVKCRTSIN